MRKLRKNLFATAAVMIVLGMGTVGHASIVFDDFNDDSGDLTGETTTTGQTWLQSSKGETGSNSLKTGALYGQGGTVGTGDDGEAGLTWKGNMIPLGLQLGNAPGVYTLSADLLKDHQGGDRQINLILRSSTQGGGRETVVSYVADRLKTIGNWFAGGDQGVVFGNPASIHIDLELTLVPGGGANSATLSWYDISNPTVNFGSEYLGTVTGTLLYDEVHILSYTAGQYELGVDNLSLVPEPATFALLALGTMILGLRRKARRS